MQCETVKHERKVKEKILPLKADQRSTCTVPALVWVGAVHLGHQPNGPLGELVGRYLPYCTYLPTYLLFVGFLFSFLFFPTSLFYTKLIFYIFQYGRYPYLLRVPR